MNITNRLKQWYFGKDCLVDPDEPDEYGGMSVIHETYKEIHWIANVVKYVCGFYLRHWKWLWGTLFLGVIAIFNQE